MIEFREFEESWNSRTGFDMTPMLDMIFILLIFFLLTAGISNRVIPVRLPKAETSEVSGEVGVIVSIKSDGSLYLNGEAVEQNNLQSKLSKLADQDASTAVFIESDKSAAFGLAVDVMDLCRRAGFAEASFLVEDKGPD